MASPAALTISDFETTTYSTSTDPSTTFSTTLESTRITRGNVTREEVQRRELLHTIDLLKLELSQKDLLVNNLKDERASVQYELEEKLSDAEHEKKMLATQLELLKRGYREEMKRAQENARAEMTTLRDKVRELEETHPRLSNYLEEVTLCLQAPLVSQSQYQVLRDKPAKRVTIQDHVMMRCYELCGEQARRAEQLEGEVRVLREEAAAREEERRQLGQELLAENGHRQELELICGQLKAQVERVGRHVQEGNFKVDTFDQVKNERDSLAREVSLLRQHLTELEQEAKHLRGEHENNRRELSASEQKLSLLTHDKEYLSKQLTETTKHCHMAEEKAQFLEHQLEETKRSREELYEKLLTSKDTHRTEFQSKLQEELELMRARTSSEVEQLKRQAKEVYERENRALVEGRDAACIERDRAVQGEKDATRKYEELLTSYRQLQVENDSRVSELTSEVKLKQFELERLQLVQEETRRNLNHCEMERGKQGKKMELLTEELYLMRADSEKKTFELEGRAKELATRLEVYEKLEKELDDVVLQAAEVGEDSDAERVLVAFGYGANLPTTSKRRLQQSVQLARRVLHLERICSSQKKQLEEEDGRAKQLSSELSKSQDLLKLSQQPYHYLLEGMRARDEQIGAQTKAMEDMEGRLTALKEERARLVKERNEAAADLEKLLAHKEELSVMRQVVVGLMSGQGREGRADRLQGGGAERLQGGGTCSTPDAAKPQHPQDMPTPTVFTRQPPPTWYRQVRTVSSKHT